ncbi:MAG: PPK2 family polyphosphate kinase, partial [Chloroflexota bacterium]
MNFDKHRVEPGTAVDLSAMATECIEPYADKSQAKDDLEDNVEKLADLQNLLYAESKHALLIILQAMDAGGKDGTIRHVMGGFNPQGVHVASFKVPTRREIAHDYLWRIHKHTPGRGEISIFNRSHYEDVLVVRVNNLVPPEMWSKRYDHINEFERLLADSGVTIRKFFLHISKREQKERFDARLEDPRKHWKFSSGDLKVREQWDDYMEAYETVLSKCSTSYAPWYVIPSDRRWDRNLVVSQ